MSGQENEQIIFKKRSNTTGCFISLPREHFSRDAIKTIIFHSINSGDSRSIVAENDQTFYIVTPDEIKSVRLLSLRNQSLAINNIVSNLEASERIIIQNIPSKK